MPGDDDEPDELPESRPTCPPKVRIAANSWIGFGSVILLIGLAGFLMIVVNAPEDQRVVVVVGGMCGLTQFLILGLMFISMGYYQTHKGIGNDTLANGIVSLVFGLIIPVIGGIKASMELAGADLVIAAGICLLSGIVLLAAGVLALAGRQQFKSWQRWDKRRAKPREN
jgi:hypothetical protein